MSQKFPQNQTSSPKAVPLCALIFTAIFSLAVAIIVTSNRFDPVKFYNAVVEHIFISHYNNFNVYHVGTIDNKNIVNWFQGIALTAAILTMFIFAFFLNIFMPKLRLSAFKALAVCWLMAFAAFSFLVQIKRAAALNEHYELFATQKPEDRIKTFIGMPYVFANECGKMIKKPMVTKYISDVPPTQDPYMTFQRGLSYYFYPKISVRLPRQGESVGHLYFYKNDVLKHIPKDHRIVCQSNDLNYVLTIQKSEFDEYIDR